MANVAEILKSLVLEPVEDKTPTADATYSRMHNRHNRG
jgi:hypothetical protein